MEPSAERAPSGARPDPAEDSGQEVLYIPFRRVGGSPERVVMLVGYALIVFQAVLRGWSKFGGWFLIDDLAFIGRAQTMDVWSADYLFEGWLGHLMPGAFALVALLTRADPWNYVPVAVVDLVAQAVLGLLLLRLLTNLFGRRPAVLVPFTVFVLSPMTLPAFLWWAASLNQLWGQIAMALVLLAHLRYHRTGRLRAGLAGVIALVGGLLFSEKVILMVPVVFLFSLLWFTPGPPVARLRLALSRSRAVWAAYAAVGLGYSVLYVVTARTPGTDDASLTIAVETAGTGLVRAVLPALIGGPLRWQQVGAGGVAAPSDGFTVLAMVVVVLLVVFSVYRRARAVFGWVVVIGYVAVNATLLGVTRATIIGPLIGAEYRYHTDELLVIVVFGSLTLLPVVGSFALGPFQRLVPRRPLPSWAEKASSEDRRRVEVVVSGSLAVVVAVMSTLSTVRFDPLWRSDVGRDYFATVERDIARAGEPVTILDTAVPPEVQNPLMAPRNSTSFLFAGMTPTPRFLEEGNPAAEVFYIPDEDGHLRIGRVEGFRNEPGPVDGCGWQVRREPVTIPLDLTTVNWVWTARIGYLASLDADAVVTMGETSTPVHVTAGAHTLYLVGRGAIGEVTISGLTYGTLCTDDIEVGFTNPVPGTGP
jgi:hypothetical protein